jgi:hypothetical protein
MVYSQAENVFIPDHYFPSNSFASVSEAFGIACPDKDVAYRIKDQNTDWQHFGIREVFVTGNMSGVGVRRQEMFSSLLSSSQKVKNRKELVCLVTLMSQRLINIVSIKVAIEIQYSVLLLINSFVCQT